VTVFGCADTVRIARGRAKLQSEVSKKIGSMDGKKVPPGSEFREKNQTGALGLIASTASDRRARCQAGQQ
jgi:hypothetical protein